ncbi:MAG TPA: hypothetical protein VM123_06440 [archaeon]|nr:hypothetical protein [archaeon]
MKKQSAPAGNLSADTILAFIAISLNTVHLNRQHSLFVTPAKAGVQKIGLKTWIPACAGMTSFAFPA